MAWDAELQQRLHFRLKQLQAYLYKPEHIGTTKTSDRLAKLWNGGY